MIIQVNRRSIEGWIKVVLFFVFKHCDYFVYMDGHSQAMVVLIPYSLGTQSFKEAMVDIKKFD